MSRVQQIDDHLVQLQSEIDSATQQREGLALLLIESPTDPAIRKHLAAVDKELATLRSEADVHRSGRNAAARRDAVSERATQIKKLKALRDTAVASGRKRAALAAQVDALLEDQLKPLLQQLQDTNDQCRQAAAAVAVACMGSEHFALQGHNIMSAAVGETGGISHAFASALMTAGIGHNGIRVQNLFNQQFGKSDLSIEDAALIDADRLASRLDHVIEVKEKSFDHLDHAVSRENLHAFGRIAKARELVAGPPPKDRQPETLAPAKPNLKT